MFYTFRSLTGKIYFFSFQLIISFIFDMTSLYFFAQVLLIHWNKSLNFLTVVCATTHSFFIVAISADENFTAARLFGYMRFFIDLLFFQTTCIYHIFFASQEFIQQFFFALKFAGFEFSQIFLRLFISTQYVFYHNLSLLLLRLPF